MSTRYERKSDIRFSETFVATQFNRSVICLFRATTRDTLTAFSIGVALGSVRKQSLGAAIPR